MDFGPLPSCPVSCHLVLNAAFQFTFRRVLKLWRLSIPVCFASEGCVGLLLVISSHNFLRCLSFSASAPFSRFSYNFLLSYLSRFLTISLIFHSCFPVQDCQRLTSVALSRFLMINLIFLFVFLFRVLPEFSCTVFLAALPTTFPDILSNKYESYFFFILTVS
jgi:hypothetical protein